MASVRISLTIKTAPLQANLAQITAPMTAVAIPVVAIHVAVIRAAVIHVAVTHVAAIRIAANSATQLVLLIAIPVVTCATTWVTAITGAKGARQTVIRTVIELDGDCDSLVLEV